MGVLSGTAKGALGATRWRESTSAPHPTFRTEPPQAVPELLAAVLWLRPAHSWPYRTSWSRGRHPTPREPLMAGHGDIRDLPGGLAQASVQRD